jgi:tetratricopeptide (TPR) repeat protein
MQQLKTDLSNSFIQTEREIKDKIRKKPGDISSYNQLGVLYAQAGKLELATPVFSKAYGESNFLSALINNLANIYCLKGDYEKAIEKYNAAITIKPKKAEYYINKGLCCFIQGKTAESHKMLNTGLSLFGNSKEIEKTLGMDLRDLGFESKGEKRQGASKNEITRQQIKFLVKNVINKVPDKKILPPSKNTLSVGGLRGVDPSQIERVADLLWWDE